MKTADRIEIDYRAAKIVGREHAALLEIRDDGQMITIMKNDPTPGGNTYEYEIWVDRSMLRQVARVYVPRTGFEASISASDAAEIIVLDLDPETVAYRTKELNRLTRKNRSVFVA